MPRSKQVLSTLYGTGQNIRSPTRDVSETEEHSRTPV